jgi:hypothetical protein
MMTRRVPPPAAFADKLARLDQQPIVVAGSRRKAALLLVACLTFMVLGVVAIAKGEDDVLAVGLPAALIFGLGVIVAGVQIARPSVMTFTMDGVTVRTIFRTWEVRWAQVDRFFVYRARAVGPHTGVTAPDMAAFTWRDPPRTARRWLTLGRASGLDGAFGAGWQLSARQLTDLLNAAQARSLGEAPRL